MLSLVSRLSTWCYPLQKPGRGQQISISICCSRLSSAANQPHVTAAVDRRDRQMDGRTDARPLHRSCTAYYAGLSSRVVSASDCGVRGSRFESRRWQLCLSRQPLRYSLEHRLRNFTAVPRSTQPSILHGTVKWVSAYGLSNNNNGDGGCGR